MLKECILEPPSGKMAVGRGRTGCGSETGRPNDAVKKRESLEVARW
ncbi:hypothetical protein HMPREF0454_04991 [Hafnia alvei ATCC 51873]|uniref:Uncharacterized protein n=1 Tax=Hafnia alvei ATCC 51873 TaxID=1002364 RepID=G9YEE2_HAFAL|nr:hypothetical protein HMPREF0454_04991 [Hafnia alvei ATCC 51873]